jgi:cytochrome c553
MRLTLALSMIALLVVTMTIQAQSRSTNPVATIKQIQEAMISPSSDTIFNVGRAAPASDEEWLVVRNAAVILAEAGNLLMLEGRAKDTEQWMDLAGELVAAGNDALVAAESQDVAAVLDSGNRIAAACEACHQPYRDGGRAMGPKTVPDQPQR